MLSFTDDVSKSAILSLAAQLPSSALPFMSQEILPYLLDLSLEQATPAEFGSLLECALAWGQFPELLGHCLEALENVSDPPFGKSSPDSDEKDDQDDRRSSSRRRKKTEKTSKPKHGKKKKRGRGRQAEGSSLSPELALRYLHFILQHPGLKDSLSGPFLRRTPPGEEEEEEDEETEVREKMEALMARVSALCEELFTGLRHRLEEAKRSPGGSLGPGTVSLELWWLDVVDFYIRWQLLLHLETNCTGHEDEQEDDGSSDEKKVGSRGRGKRRTAASRQSSRPTEAKEEEDLVYLRNLQVSDSPSFDQCTIPFPL